MKSRTTNRITRLEMKVFLTLKKKGKKRKKKKTTHQLEKETVNIYKIIRQN